MVNKIQPIPTPPNKRIEYSNSDSITHMEQLQSFFVKTSQHPPSLAFQTPIMIEHPLGEMKCFAHNFNGHISFSDCSKPDQVFDLKVKCKIEPVVRTNCELGDGSIESVLMHDESNSQQIRIRFRDQEQANNCYHSLNRIVSHKGFNQYFKPIKRLGRGTFATVYLVEHKLTKHQMAAKVFSREGHTLEFKGREALQNQIKTLRELDHPNIISYKGIYETENLIYLMTEYISGGTLEDTMKAKCSLSGSVISKIISDVLQGLQYLESKHIMHRDIKPENIIFRKDDEKWVICDFGLAARSTEDYLYDKCGTMGYIAPEIMSINEENKQRYSQECDVYSLGIIAYTLIVGSLPFKVEVENMFDKKIVWEFFDKPECSEIHPDILDFLKGLLQKDPTQRIKPDAALKSAFFTNKEVQKSLVEFHERRIKERYDKILKMANLN